MNIIQIKVILLFIDTNNYTPVWKLNYEKKPDTNCPIRYNEYMVETQQQKIHLLPNEKRAFQIFIDKLEEIHVQPMTVLLIGSKARGDSKIDSKYRCSADSLTGGQHYP